MAGVMKGALRLDEEKEVETKQLIVRLATENKVSCEIELNN